MKIVDSASMAGIDRLAMERFHIPQILLMEGAAGGGYRELRGHVWGGRLPEGEVVFLAGRGNNGGDALVMARLCLLEGKRDLLVVLGAGPPHAGSLAEAHLRTLEALGAEVVDFEQRPSAVRRRLSRAAWVVDGLLGTGLKGEARGGFGALVGAVNASGAKTVAVDVPSGVGDSFRKGYAAVRATATLTMGLPKLCLYLPDARPLCGEIRVIRGVFPPQLLEAPEIQAELLEETSLGELLCPIAPETYKTARGHLAVFAGSEGTTGAAWLCSHAAARSRTGLVTLHMQRELYPACVAAYSSVMIRGWDPEAAPSALPLERFTALLVGPGWGMSGDREQWLEQLLGCGLPGLLDADGLSLLAGLSKRRRVSLGERWVLTPHPGELARLTGQEVGAVLADPVPLLRRTSAALRATIVLKAHCTYVCAPDGRLWVLDGMNPALATGGSGDVLSGIIAGQLAGGIEPTAAARVGVLLHSVAGRRALEARGYFTADELLPFVSLLSRNP
ncbi:MAG: NAD(P)H-hydrate dehydratase [Spirochaetales bacterium]|nr:NAD(P)H-hydrate dehydratase [Spirochaetales bacterium]